MTATRFLPFLLGGMTLIVLFANALPAAKLKHRLQVEQRKLVEQFQEGAKRQRLLVAEIDALRNDPFYIERVCTETWRVAPEGAIAMNVHLRADPQPRLSRARGSRLAAHGYNPSVKCFNHPDRDAVTACKQCVKGLCMDCSHAGTGGMSCGGECAELVRFQHELLMRSQKTIQNAFATARNSMLFVSLMGAGMAGFGWYFDSHFAIAIGLMMLVLGLLGIWSARKAAKAQSEQ